MSFIDVGPPVPDQVAATESFLRQHIGSFVGYYDPALPPRATGEPRFGVVYARLDGLIEEPPLAIVTILSRLATVSASELGSLEYSVLRANYLLNPHEVETELLIESREAGDRDVGLFVPIHIPEPHQRLSLYLLEQAGVATINLPQIAAYRTKYEHDRASIV